MKLEWIAIDTVTALQSDQYMMETSKPTHDVWREYGNEIYRFFFHLQFTLGFTLIEVLGNEGTGKSFALKTLDETKGIWYHPDNKPITFKGGKGRYRQGENFFEFFVKGGKKLPLSADLITAHLTKKITENAFEEDRYCFIIGHLMEYKGLNDQVQVRLKTLGKAAHKANLEGKFALSLYTHIVTEEGKNKYYFDTQNIANLNTCRSPEGMFETRYIPNDLNFVLESMKNY